MDSFWESMNSFAKLKVGVDKEQASSCAEMHETDLQTRKVIAESRDLMQRVERLLARDLWQPKQKQHDP